MDDLNFLAVVGLNFRAAESCTPGAESAKEAPLDPYLSVRGLEPVLEKKIKAAIIPHFSINQF